MVILQYKRKKFVLSMKYNNKIACDCVSAEELKMLTTEDKGITILAEHFIWLHIKDSLQNNEKQL